VGVEPTVSPKSEPIRLVFGTDDPLVSGGRERRGKPRIYEDFQVRIWGVTAEGGKFEIEVPVENLSSSGLCVHLPYQLETGEGVMVLIRFSNAVADPDGWPRVAACGTVVRSRERSPHDRHEWETAVRFTEHVIV